MLGFIWFTNSRQKRRQLTISVTIFVLTYLIVISEPILALTIQELLGTFPVDSGAAVDAIVVLGRGNELRNNRIETAAKLWEAKRAPKLFASGMMDAPQIIRRLETKGIPIQVLSGESCSQSTEENALFTATILHPLGIRRILLITDFPHMLRSFLTFSSFGFTVVPHTSSMPPNWTSKQKLLLMFREDLGLIGYALMGQFQPRSDSEIKYPPALVFEKLSNWHCRL